MQLSPKFALLLVAFVTSGVNALPLNGYSSDLSAREINADSYSFSARDINEDDFYLLRRGNEKEERCKAHLKNHKFMEKLEKACMEDDKELFHELEESAGKHGRRQYIGDEVNLVRRGKKKAKAQKCKDHMATEKFQEHFVKVCVKGEHHLFHEHQEGQEHHSEGKEHHHHDGQKTLSRRQVIDEESNLALVRRGRRKHGKHHHEEGENRQEEGENRQEEPEHPHGKGHHHQHQGGPEQADGLNRLFRRGRHTETQCTEYLHKYEERLVEFCIKGDELFGHLGVQRDARRCREHLHEKVFIDGFRVACLEGKHSFFAGL